MWDVSRRYRMTDGRRVRLLAAVWPRKLSAKEHAWIADLVAVYGYLSEQGYLTDLEIFMNAEERRRADSLIKKHYVEDDDE